MIQFIFELYDFSSGLAQDIVFLVECRLSLQKIQRDMKDKGSLNQKIYGSSSFVLFDLDSLHPWMQNRQGLGGSQQATESHSLLTWRSVFASWYQLALLAVNANAKTS